MVERKPGRLSVKRQCRLLGVSRSSIYYAKRAGKEEDLLLMRRIDEQYLKTPTWGSRSMSDHLRRLGFKVNRKRVRRLMRCMGIAAIYPRPKTSKPQPGHKVYPYLLRGMVVDRPNQVWCADITYVPMRHGFMYLVAVMDWYSRKVLSWNLSNTLDSDFCVAALETALHRHGTPVIFNTDQGSQFTSEKFTSTLERSGVRISMDGRGRFQDNIFIERLWWTVKYQYLYLHEFENGVDVRNGLRGWFRLYNEQRPHQALKGKTPDEVYQQVREAA
jgi:putative transposase